MKKLLVPLLLVSSIAQSSDKDIPDTAAQLYASTVSGFFDISTRISSSIQGSVPAIVSEISALREKFRKSPRASEDTKEQSTVPIPSAHPVYKILGKATRVICNKESELPRYTKELNEPTGN